jgi:hypothetical protein
VKRLAVALLLVLLAGCSHQDLKPPCIHPSLADAMGGCGPVRPIQ